MNKIDVPFKIGDKVQILPQDIIDKNKLKCKFSYLTDSTYAKYRGKELTIVDIYDKNIDGHDSLSVNVSADNTTITFYYPLEIKGVETFVVDLL